MNNEEEYLDFTDSLEIIDLNDEVDSKIDEMLDFFDTPNDTKNAEKNKKEIDNLISDSKEINQINISESSNNKLQNYKSNIKKINIKNEKHKKLTKKVMIYTIIVMLFLFEIFISKANNTLNNVKVLAGNYIPIMISQNNKYGFIDEDGKTIVNPKYSYAENFVNGYSIVKNSSNNTFIINKGGKVVVKPGKYFSIKRSNDDIIASISTKNGLKYGILSSNLKVKTKFIYDSINYIDDCYTFVKGNVVGVINLDGKQIFKYELPKNVEKQIDVIVSKVSLQTVEKYAVVKVNSSSFIINIKDGFVVCDATLNKVLTNDNNVFYEIDSNNKTYKYIENNNVVLESDSYIAVDVKSISSGIIKATLKDFKNEYISNKTKEKIYPNLNESEVYQENDLFSFESYDYKHRKPMFNIVEKGEIIKTIDKTFDIEKPFVNGIAIITFNDNTYSYINKDGNIITDLKFTFANAFDSYGHAIAKTNEGYGVINKDGKVLINFNNADIKQAKEEYKFNNNSNKYAFFAVKKDNRYKLYNRNGKKISNKFYNNVSFDDLYPVIKLEDDLNDYLYIQKTNSKIKLSSSKTEYKVYNNYIVMKNEYYNYKGNLIFKKGS